MALPLYNLYKDKFCRYIMQKNITPVAIIENDYKEKFGIPRNSGRAKSVISKITFLKGFRSVDAVRGLEDFSHIWLIFDFSLIKQDKFSPLVRPPRLGGNKKVGVFASRSPFRPNGLGLSCVKIEKIDLEDNNAPVIYVSGADLLDGTPIFDIKPYIPFADCQADAVGGFADDNADYKLNVVFDAGIKEKVPQEKLHSLIECLEDDPRPSYQNDDRLYGMTFANFNVKFSVKDSTLYVHEIEFL